MRAMVIYKYPIATSDGSAVAMPRGARVLHVGVQAGKPCLWAMVDLEAPVVGRWLYVFGTGHPLPVPIADLTYLGTVLMGAFVWHVFIGPEEDSDS